MLQLFPDDLHLVHRIYLGLCTNLEKIEDVYLPAICVLLTNYCKVYIQRPQMSETEAGHLSLLQKKAIDILTHSQSYSAIASLSALLYHLLPPKEYSVLEKPLLRMLNGPEHYRQIGLNLMVAILERCPTALEHSLHYMRLSITSTEYCKHRKLDILKLMANEGNIKWIQKELDYWIRYVSLQTLARRTSPWPASASRLSATSQFATLRSRSRVSAA
jgi:hypothetical protein